MRVLLDTHVYLWVRFDNRRRLPDRFHTEITDPANTKFVSSISAAEIAVKRAVGKFGIEVGPDDDPSAFGLDELPFTQAHARVLDELPLIHRDPFDRMLIAQAIAEDLIFLTVDERCMQYDVRLLG